VTVEHFEAQRSTIAGLRAEARPCTRATVRQTETSETLIEVRKVTADEKRTQETNTGPFTQEAERLGAQSPYCKAAPRFLNTSHCATSPPRTDWQKSYARPAPARSTPTQQFGPAAKEGRPPRQQRAKRSGRTNFRPALIAEAATCNASTGTPQHEQAFPQRSLPKLSESTPRTRATSWLLQKRHTNAINTDRVCRTSPQHHQEPAGPEKLRIDVLLPPRPNAREGGHDRVST